MTSGSPSVVASAMKSDEAAKLETAVMKAFRPSYFSHAKDLHETGTGLAYARA